MTQETANFIADRALSLHYECRKYRDTAPMTLLWLYRAVKWARKHGHMELAETLDHQKERLFESMYLSKGRA